MRKEEQPMDLNSPTRLDEDQTNNGHAVLANTQDTEKAQGEAQRETPATEASESAGAGDDGEKAQGEAQGETPATEVSESAGAGDDGEQGDGRVVSAQGDAQEAISTAPAGVTPTGPPTSAKPARRKRTRRERLYIGVVLCFLLSLLVGGGLFVYKDLHTLYEQDFSLANAGEQQLRQAISQLQSLPDKGLDAALVRQASGEFTASLNDFTQVNASLSSFPALSSSIPVYGSRLAAALHVLPLAIVASQAGQQACVLLQTVLLGLQNPLSSQGQGLTEINIRTIDKQFEQVETLVQRAVGLVQGLQPSDLQLDPRLGKLLTAFRTAVPQVQTALTLFGQMLPALPGLLGVGQPSNYLVEVLDTTELRPGGGFIGSYGLMTLAGGKLTSTSITDSYLLDNAFTASGHSIPIPQAYQWFDLVSKWSLRDSNLEADFPTDARNAEQLYQQEGGKTAFQGVLAITPAFISGLLEITGPIFVAEYHETVTAQNLIDRIHYYQLGAGRVGQDTPSPDGKSSVRKHFTAVLAEQLFARVRQLSPSSLGSLLHLLTKSMQTKDVQVYFNAPSAEKLLSTYQLASGLQPTSGDSLLVVDANIGGSKANALIADTLSDQVTIDQAGSVTHQTTLTYAWHEQGNVYGQSLYRDYIRVYTPSTSTLLTQSGWSARGSGAAFGLNVWSGFFQLTYGHTVTIHLTWTVAGMARKLANGWQYNDLIQHQAGARTQLVLQVAVPASAQIISAQGSSLISQRSLVHHGSSLHLEQPLTGDVSIQIGYNTA